MRTLRKPDDPAAIDASALVKRSTIGVGSAVGPDAVVLESQVGEQCDIEARNLLNHARVGDMTYTGPDVSITWAEVGRFCCIARQVDIGGNEHNYRAASMMPTYRVMNRLAGKVERHQEEPLVRVGNDVWIGSGAVIVRKEGLTIGDGAVIGAGAVVTHSVEPYAIVTGVPARVTGYRFERPLIERLLDLQWWNWPRERILDAWELLSQDLTEEMLDKLAACE